MGFCELCQNKWKTGATNRKQHCQNIMKRENYPSRIRRKNKRKCKFPRRNGNFKTDQFGLLDMTYHGNRK
jgi:hypothetical protein